MSSAKPILLYFYAKRSTFIARDIDMLSNRYDVREHAFEVRHKALLPIAFLKQKLFLLRNMGKAAVTVTHIGGYVSFLPALWTSIFKLPSLVIIAGTDGARFPGIRYGNFNRKVMGWFTRMSYRMASHLAPVDGSLIDVPYTYDPVGAPRQGYRHFCPEVNTPCTVIHYGYDADEWPILFDDRPKDSFITVIAGIDSEAIFLRKGVDLILETARLVPEASFTLVGATPNNPWLQDVPENVHLHPVTDRNGLVALLNRHRFYLQMSLMEGFPNALCEAMLCGCVPIGSNVSAIPLIIDQFGYVLERKDAQAFASLARKAMAEDDIEPMHVRESIVERFPKSRRFRELVALIDHLVENRSQPPRK